MFSPVSRSLSAIAAALLLFGAHLLVIGYLACRSGHVPRVLGVLLAVAGLGYIVDSLAAVLVRGPWTDVSLFTFAASSCWASGS